MRSKQPSDADSQGEPLPRGDLVDGQVQVLGCRLFRVSVWAAGVAFRARVVQTPPPPGWGGPLWLFDRHASGVSARLDTRSAPLGAAPGRFVRGLVCCPACGRVPVIRGGSVFSPRGVGGVPGRTTRGVPPGAPVQALHGCPVAPGGCAGRSALGLFWGAFLQDSMKASKESSLRVCPPGDGPLLVARRGLSGVVALALGSAWA